MKDFDEERDPRAELPDEIFKIAGKQFRLKPRMPARALSSYADLQLHSMGGTLHPQTFENLVDVIRASIHQDDQTSWGELMEVDLDNPITMDDLLGIANHIVEKNTARPTPPLSDSGTTEESGSTKLTVASVLPEAKVQPASTSAVG